MSFDLYFAGSQNQECEDWMLNNGCCRLQSQLNDRKNIQYWVDNEFSGKLFIDSGAYTAYTRQVTVDVDEYINYVNSIDHKLALFAQVDKIPGSHGQPKTKEQIQEAPEISWQNYLYMRERVKSPDKLLPIFHRREDWKYLEQMLETTFDGKHIPYIGIAATTDSSVKEKQEWFDKVFQIIKHSSNPNVKTHAFGMTSLRLLENYPFTSADSTSWIMTGANGSIRTPFGVVVVSENVMDKNTHVQNMSSDAAKNLNDYLTSIGLSLEEVATDYKKRMLANLKYLKTWSDNYQYKGNSNYVKRLF
jgi:hypothetical protein